METGIEDGEEAATFASTYVNVTCVVTSDTGNIDVIAGERKNPLTLRQGTVECTTIAVEH